MTRTRHLAIFGLRPSILFHLYGRRLRFHTVQELLAGCGVAVGVALILGVMLANASLLGSTERTINGVIGAAKLELAARSDDGFPRAIAGRVEQLHGVQVAAPVLQENASIIGPKGRLSVQLLGATPTLLLLGGTATQNLGVAPSLLGKGVGLPYGVADAIGARPGGEVTVLSAGQAHKSRVSAVLGPDAVGSATGSPLVVALLGVAQELAGRPNRVTQVLVRPYSGDQALVARELQGVAAGHLNVVPADNELILLLAIAKPSSQATTMFALIGAMVGFLFTFNAILLTVPERRRYVADLRMQGYDWRQVLAVLGFEALILGVAASVVGVLLGYLLARTLFHQVPVYLAFAFPVGDRQIVEVPTFALAIGCGVLATLLASLLPVFDLRPDRPRDTVLRQANDGGRQVSHLTAIRLGVGGVVLVGTSTVAALLAPHVTIVSGVVLALATICFIPWMFIAAASALRWMSERIVSSALVLAVRELRVVSLPMVALAGVGALAIYGSVAVGGARHDLLTGLNTNFHEYLDTADLWVTTGGNDLTTNSFQPGTLQSSVARAPGVASVRNYQGELMDIGGRRVWVIARSPNDPAIIPPSQLQSGNLTLADQLLRQSGWAAVSNTFAQEHHLRVGSQYELPTPSGPHPFRVAATLTNMGWPSGAVLLNTRDYSRYWQTVEPSALEVLLKPGVGELVGKHAVEGVLAGHPGLAVQTKRQREMEYQANSRQAVAALGEISTLLLIAAALAVAAALIASIWQRRPELASLKIQGYDRYQLWRALLLESSIVLGFGCAIGAIFGMYGHALASRWLTISTGSPAPFTLGVLQVLIDLALVAGIGLLVIALPGLMAAKVSPLLALQE
jgi:putative ABC transport system permease protein